METNKTLTEREEMETLARDLRKAGTSEEDIAFVTGISAAPARYPFTSKTCQAICKPCRRRYYFEKTAGRKTVSTAKGRQWIGVACPACGGVLGQTTQNSTAPTFTLDGQSVAS